MEKIIRKRTLTCIDTTRRCKCFVVECESGLKYIAIKDGHTCYSTYDRMFSGKQLDNVSAFEFTYYGNGTKERPDCIADMDTFLWLLRDLTTE